MTCTDVLINKFMRHTECSHCVNWHICAFSCGGEKKCSSVSVQRLRGGGITVYMIIQRERSGTSPATAHFFQFLVCSQGHKPATLSPVGRRSICCPNKEIKAVLGGLSSSQLNVLKNQ